MTEQEKRESEALKNCIQEAYGLSDEQLLAELEELEATLSDDEFVGAEERIYERIMQREMEKGEEASKAFEMPEILETPEIPDSNPTPIRKISKKKRWLVVGIAAALVVGASMNTIGDKTYFLREREKEYGTVLNSGQNIVKTGDLQEAYEKIEETLDITALKINNLPDTLRFENLILDDTRAVLVFSNRDHKVYFIQRQESIERSMGINSDRKLTEKFVHNSWLSMDIFIEDIQKIF